MTRNTLTFDEIDGRTTITTITTIVRYSSTAARDAALRTGRAGGMEAGYARLDAMLAGQLADAAAR